MSKAYWWILGIAVMLASVPASVQAEPDGRSLDSTQGAVINAQPAATPELAEYWLGVGCRPVPPALQAHLNLPEKQGLLVEAVVPGSPAAKAGVVEHDILLRAGGKPLAERRDLVRAIEANKSGKLAVELIHCGKPKTVEATPAKRPEEVRADGAPASADWDTMEKWLRGMSPGNELGGARSPLRFRFVHPGMIVPQGVAVAPALPPGMSVVISKEGDQPAKIVVRRGASRWEVTEKDLDKLPADVRPHVDQMLGRGAMGLVASFVFLGDGAGGRCGPRRAAPRRLVRTDGEAV